MTYPLRRFAAALLLSATPATADIAPDIAAALDVCLADGPAIKARIGTLGTAGWHVPDAIEKDSAARAFAPYHVLRLAAIKDGQSLLERLDALATAAVAASADIDRGLPGDLFLVTDSGAVLRLYSRNPATADCAIAAPLDAADMAAHSGLTADTTSGPIYISTVFSTPGTDDRRAYHDRFAPGLFGATDPLPVILTLSARITD